MEKLDTGEKSQIIHWFSQILNMNVQMVIGNFKIIVGTIIQNLVIQLKNQH